MSKIFFTEEQKQYIIEQYTQKKKSTYELGKEMGCSRDTITRRLKKWGVAIKRFFPYEDLSGKQFGDLLVLEVNQERYNEEVKRTNKPHRYWKCLCSCGRLTEVESSHLKNGHTTSCGHIKSNGEQKITKILRENNIPFTSELYFNDLRGYGNGLLRFDFGILENNTLKYLIEYNGKQHYKQTGGWCTEKEFEIRQYNDNKKIEYCKEKNIPLIIIPYTQYDKLVLDDLLLDKTKFRKEF